MGPFLFLSLPLSTPFLSLTLSLFCIHSIMQGVKCNKSDWTLWAATLVINPPSSVCAWLQEVILKRAADLVEALYGMPHNNQVNSLLHTHTHRQKHKQQYLLLDIIICLWFGPSGSIKGAYLCWRCSTLPCSRKIWDPQTCTLDYVRAFYQCRGWRWD